MTRQWSSHTRRPCLTFSSFPFPFSSMKPSGEGKKASRSEKGTFWFPFKKALINSCLDYVFSLVLLPSLQNQDNFWHARMENKRNLPATEKILLFPSSGKNREHFPGRFSIFRPETLRPRPRHSYPPKVKVESKKVVCGQITGRYLDAWFSIATDSDFLSGFPQEKEPCASFDLSHRP